MSAYVKFVCDYCGENEIEFEIGLDSEFDEVDSIESARSLLRDYGWDNFDGAVCRACDV